jgi:hypothetical protein
VSVRIENPGESLTTSIFIPKYNITYGKQPKRIINGYETKEQHSRGITGAEVSASPPHGT